MGSVYMQATNIRTIRLYILDHNYIVVMATFGSEHSEWISGILEQFNSKIDGDVFVRGGLVFL